jgi:mevalonate kinase
MKPVTVSTPGKLILMGEHAVVYGRPALVAAVDLRLSARLSPCPSLPGGVRLDLPDLPDLPDLHYREDLSWDEVRRYARAARERWDAYAREPGPNGFRTLRGDDPAHVVKAALGEAIEALEELGIEPREGVELRVRSELPIGSGFGSSAATAVGVLAATLAAFGRDASPAAPADIERLALEVERRQHGLPSGADGAAILRGGVLHVRRLPSGALAIEPVAVRSPLLSRLRVYDTGTPPEATGAVVAAVRGRRDRDPARHEAILDRMEAATAAFRDELERQDEDRERALHLIREHQACLEELGVVPEPVRSVVRNVETAGGAAKISGAGSLAGPGAGCLLVYHPDPQAPAGWPFLQKYPFHPVHLGASGFRQEAAG